MTPSAPAWSAGGNDYRPIRTLQPAVVAGVTVVIEGEATSGQLEALSAQTQMGVRVVVVGGSAAEDVIAVETLDEAMATTDGSDVIAVLASGDIPNPQWLEAHLAWHRRAGNVVVIGESPDATRARLVRGSRRLLGNDDVFAAFQGSNVSFPRASWGSGWDHDLLSGWRLWNDGHFFAYEPGASTSHEDHHTSSGPVPGPRWADLIPHRTYRPGPPSPLYSTPKVSWVVSVASAAEADAAWTTCASSTYSDVEIVFHGPEPALERFTALSVGNPRVTTSSSGFGDAIRVSRGELVAILDPRARVPGELLGKAVSRFEEKPSSPIVRSAYAVNGDRYLRLDDLAAIDAEIGRDALPFFALVTRRELMKDRTIWSDPANRAWSMVLDRCTKSTVIAPVVGIPETVDVVPHRPGLADLASIGPRMIVRELVRQSRQQARADESEATSDTGRAPERVQVAYVGFIGHDNLGDEAVKVAIERLMPWGEFSAEPTDPKLLMIGGGTLINGRRYYLNRMLRQESAVVERAMFGTGVRSPEYWGVTEPMDDWFTFIDSAIFAAVRGPDSVRNLRTMGYERDLPIIGDPALSLEVPQNAERVDGRVVICPVYTNGNLHGGDDSVVFDALARLIARVRADGREVVMLSAFPQDDRWIIDIMKRAGAPEVEYLAGYADIDDTMALLASADVVVGERLHAAIMAAAAGTPFVGLEYRPKMRDFARSIDQESAIIRTDQMERLDELCTRILSSRDEVAGAIREAVSRFRTLQTAAANDLESRFMSR